MFSIDHRRYYTVPGRARQSPLLDYNLPGSRIRIFSLNRLRSAYRLRVVQTEEEREKGEGRRRRKVCVLLFLEFISKPRYHLIVQSRPNSISSLLLSQCSSAFHSPHNLPNLSQSKTYRSPAQYLVFYSQFRRVQPHNMLLGSWVVSANKYH